MTQQDFGQWFKELKENAVADFGYTETETSNFSEKSWKQYYEQGLTPFEAVVQHLKKIFKHQNG